LNRRVVGGYFFVQSTISYWVVSNTFSACSMSANTYLLADRDRSQIILHAGFVFTMSFTASMLAEHTPETRTCISLYLYKIFQGCLPRPYRASSIFLSARDNNNIRNSVLRI
jgi:hypothetical protein